MGVEMSNTFKVEVAKDGKSQEVELRVNLPDNESVTEGEKAYNKRFSEALSSGAFLRIKMDDIAKEQGLWSDDKQQELTEMQNEIATARPARIKINHSSVETFMGLAIDER